MNLGRKWIFLSLPSQPASLVNKGNVEEWNILYESGQSVNWGKWRVFPIHQNHRGIGETAQKWIYNNRGIEEFWWYSHFHGKVTGKTNFYCLHGFSNWPIFSLFSFSSNSPFRLIRRDFLISLLDRIYYCKFTGK